MRSDFAEYYKLTKKQLVEIGNRAIFAFDASFLLDFYRYSDSTAKEMFLILEGLKNQAWVPYQAAFEFHKNRFNVLGGLKSKHAEAVNCLEEDGQKLIRGIQKACAMHPLMDPAELTKPILKAIQSAQKKLSVVSDKHTQPTFALEDDPIWLRIETIFRNRVGGEYSDEQLRAHEMEAKKRFDKRVPPGFEDLKKDYPWGDYILWRQLLDHCREEKRPAIFVTSDVKEDWWFKYQGKKFGPLPALRKEFKKETGQEFHIYETTNFIETYAPQFNVSAAKPVDEIRKIRADKSAALTLEDIARVQFILQKDIMRQRDDLATQGILDKLRQDQLELQAVTSAHKSAMLDAGLAGSGIEAAQEHIRRMMESDSVGSELRKAQDKVRRIIEGSDISATQDHILRILEADSIGSQLRKAQDHVRRMMEDSGVGAAQEHIRRMMQTDFAGSEVRIKQEKALRVATKVAPKKSRGA